ncbi:MAG: hypothetical protein Q8L16_00755 [Hydrogenophaga sp.]|nr:hypothetical protein [Hydrogenophaga sp.]
MLIGVPAGSTVGETRVAVISEMVSEYMSSGHTVKVLADAGVAAC